MESKAEFGAQQFAAGYANGCADRDELIAALSAMVLNDRHTYRDCHKAAVRILAKARAQ